MSQGTGAAPSVSKLSAGSNVHVKVADNVNLEALQKIVVTIVTMHGCRTCGLLGLDLRLSGDPVEAGELSKLPGVQSVTIA